MDMFKNLLFNLGPFVAMLFYILYKQSKNREALRNHFQADDLSRIVNNHDDLNRFSGGSSHHHNNVYNSSHNSNYTFPHNDIH